MEEVNVFSYEEFISRNYGFVNEAEQNLIRKARVFVPGVGGMGGACFEALVRLGVQNFIVADNDVFEISNFNRQLAADLNTVGVSKVAAVIKRAQSINPQIQIKSFGLEWVDHLAEILPQVDFVVNGTDDIKCTILLMRKAKEFKKTVIDAFSATLPSVYVVHPEAPRPEEIMEFPTSGLRFDEITPAVEAACKLRELEYVLVHSTSINHVHWDLAREVFEGKRKRFSLAPMVLMTGNLMAYEALKIIIGQKSIVSERGVFLNPWTTKFEKPLCWPLRVFKKWFVRWQLSKHF